MSARRLTCLLAITAACGGSRAPAETTPAPAATSDAEDAELGALKSRMDSLDERLSRIETLLGEALEPPPEPDTDTVYSMPIEGDPYEGAENAKVTVVKAFEFACGYCYQARETVDEILESYEGDVKVVYKYFVVHDAAVPAGLAACAAHRQGKFDAMKELIWEKGFAAEDLSGERMSDLATEAGLDMEQYEADMKGQECKGWLVSSYRTLSNLGVRGTPAWFVNGRFVSGAQPFEAFAELIDEEMAKANEAIAGGVPLADYYQRAVVDEGKEEL